MWGSKSSRYKKASELRQALQSPKDGYFLFEQIKRYQNKADTRNIRQTISDKTSADLDLDEVFMFTDRTISKVGQQYLYHILRTIPKDQNRTNNINQLIDALKKSPELKNEVTLELSQLQSNDGYGIVNLFLDTQVSKPSWFWVIQLLSTLSLACSIFSFILPWLLIPLIALFATNLVFHFWNKGNIYQYSSSIPLLITLKNVALSLSKNTELTSSFGNKNMHQSISAVNSICKKMIWFRLEAKIQDDLTMIVDSFFEYLKILFLLEPILLFNAVNRIERKKNEIHDLYSFVGLIDTGLSISILRSSTKKHCIPHFLNNENALSAKNLYHPLIPDCVENSINTSGLSVLLTGSNMSGKTTFIRTIGINAILAQTINTCFASEFSLPEINIYSAVRISDDLLSNKSYYLEEVSTIKAMIEQCTSEIKTLFLLDEIFKGTNTVERIAAGKSVLSHLAFKNLVFVSTHDSELTGYLKEEYDMYHFTEVIEEDNIVFDHKLKTGVLETTNAIQILKMNGYPITLTTEAESIAREIKNTQPQR
jgi:DNA mismatch repair ATPase MutS